MFVVRTASRCSVTGAPATSANVCRRGAASSASSSADIVAAGSRTAASVATAPSSPLFDVERQAQRRAWPARGSAAAATSTTASASDVDAFAFPREALGRDYALNWTIARYDLVAQREAFRNLHTRGLLMRARTDTVTFDRATKALHVDVDASASASSASASTTALYTAGELAGGASAARLTDAVASSALAVGEYEAVLKQVRAHLGADADAVYVRDGALGGAGGDSDASLLVRVFSDCAAADLLAAQLVHAHATTTTASPAGDDGDDEAVAATAPHSAAEFAHSLVVYVAATLPSVSLRGRATRGPLVLVDVEERTAVVVGTGALSSSVLRAALAAVFQHATLGVRVAADGDGSGDAAVDDDSTLPVVLPRSACAHTTDGRVVLMLGGAASAADGAHVATAPDHVWSTSSGCSALFAARSVAKPDALARGELVESDGSTLRVAGTSSSSSSSSSVRPDAVVVFSSSASGAKVSAAKNDGAAVLADYAKQHLGSGYAAAHAANASAGERLTALVAASGAKVFEAPVSMAVVDVLKQV